MQGLEEEFSFKPTSILKAYLGEKHTMYCSQCGKELQSESSFCSECGTPISSSLSHDTKQQNSNSQPSNAAPSPTRSKIIASEVTEQDLRSFIGPYADRYLSRWAKSTNPLHISWNWAGLLMLYWMGFRKMYLFATLYYILFVISLFAGILINEITQLLSIFIFAMWGDALYYRYALAKIHKIKAAFPKADTDELQAKLAAKGGRSLLGMIVTIIGVVIGAISLTFL